MIRRMGSVAIRLWIIALVTTPVCFYAMPLILEIFPGVSTAIPAGILFMILGGSIGVSFDFIGRKLIKGMIKEGEVWERAGILSRAEKTYDNALSLYTSFLLSPLFDRKVSTRLTGTLARFSLTNGIETPQLKLASTVYLKSSPGDETLATLWLGRLKKGGIAGAIEQEVLTSLANVHYTHKKLMVPLADVLLDLGRMDYAAKRVYKTLLEDSGLAADIKSDFRRKIQRLLGEPEELLETLENNFVGRVVSISPNPVAPKSVAPKSVAPTPIGHRERFLSPVVFTTIAGGVKRMGRGGSFFVRFCILSFGRVFVLIRERQRVRFYFRAGAMGILSVWLLFFMGSTISHILKSRSLEKEPRMIEIKSSKPFTIQVAAYLKQAHADRYAKILGKKGVSPFISKVTGGGKTWYVVRISEFQDKAAAAAFGKKLKAEKVIDDFFVSNKSGNSP